MSVPQEELQNMEIDLKDSPIQTSSVQDNLEASGKLHWRIENWTSVQKEEKLFSPEFTVANYKWRILLLPNADGENIAVYLQVHPLEDKDDWNCCCEFQLTINNCEDANICISQSAKARFSRAAAYEGFSDFAAKEHLTMSIPPFERPLIENDEFILSADVRIIKDPNGTLWYDFYNYDSKKETGFVGMSNQGATCYLNSLLQSLYCTNYFRKNVFHIPTESMDPSKNMPLALQRVFYDLQFGSEPVCTSTLTKSFGWDTLESFMQHDVQELNRVLLDSLETKMKGTVADGCIKKLFCGETTSFIRCLDVDYTSSRDEEFYDLSMIVKGKKDLMESFQEFTKTEVLDDKYNTEDFGPQRAEKGASFKRFPDVLHIQLQRYEFDIEREAMVKINDRFEFPETLDLAEFVEDSQGSVFKLHGVLVHSGDSHGGHYFSFIKPNTDSSWLKFDDDKVTKATVKEAIEDNFGGDFAPIESRSSRLHRYKKFTNAYMLVYIRENSLSEILCEVTEKDIPEHLKSMFEEEKAAKKAHLEAKVRQHMFTKVKIIHESMMAKHHGYDLVNFQDTNFPPTECIELEIEKKKTLGDLKEVLFREYQIQPEDIRLWNISQRRNRTFRLDPPLSAEMSEEDSIVLESLISGREVKLFAELKNSNEEFEMLSPNADKVLIFVKSFNPESKSLHYAGKLIVNVSETVESQIRRLQEMTNISDEIYITEEIKVNFLMPVRIECTFEKNEIGHGDILIVEPKNETGELKKYYEGLADKIVVNFKPLASENTDSFQLVLKKSMPFAVVVENVARHLTIDDLSKITLTSASLHTGAPKYEISDDEGLNLGQILRNEAFGAQDNLMYFEIKELSSQEMENKMTISLVYLKPKDPQLCEETLIVPKGATVNQLQECIFDKIDLSESKRIRILEVANCRIYKEYTGNDSLDSINPLTTNLVDEIPLLELELQEGDKVVEVFHFHNHVNNTHGIPFKMVIKKGWTLSEFKDALVAKYKFPDSLKSKVKVFACVFGKLNAFENDQDISLYVFQENEQIGLDIPDRNRSRLTNNHAIKIQ